MRQGPRRPRHGVPQEERSEGRRHGPQQLGLSPAAELPRGIEAGISCLKRAYGLARCTWRGLVRFKACVWSSVVAYNLALFARLRPA